MAWKKSITVDRAANRIYQRLVKRCEALAEQTHNHIVQLIEDQAPPHSVPGEPANRLTGEMIDAQAWSVNAGPTLATSGGRILVEWTNASMHSVWTEFGTGIKAEPFGSIYHDSTWPGYFARPWFRPGLVFSIDVFMRPNLTS